MDVSIYRLRTRDILVLCVLALLAMGVVMVQSASMNAASPGWNAVGIKHLLFASASIIAFFIVGQFDFSWLGRVPAHFRRSPIFWLIVIAAILNVAVLIPHVGVAINGARRWLKIGPVQLQPSEFAKWAVVLFLAFCLSRRPINLDNFLGGFVVMMAPIVAICLLVVIQDFGTATLIALCALTMMLAGRIKITHLLVTVPPVLLAAAWFMMHKQYRWHRVTAFLNPYADPKKEGYHMIQSLLSFATGGVPGRGLGNGIQKLGYLPEDTTDFIFAVICEELGLFGALFTVCLYIGILYVTWQAIRENKNDFGKMLAFGIGSMVGLQAMINIAVATVSVPTKGLSLPLISAGGSGLVITCGALGLLLSVCRHNGEASQVSIQTL